MRVELIVLVAALVVLIPGIHSGIHAVVRVEPLPRGCPPDDALF
jgi:hypothetical protein